MKMQENLRRWVHSKAYSILTIHLIAIWFVLKLRRIVWAALEYNELAKSPIDFFFDRKMLGLKNENAGKT